MIIDNALSAGMFNAIQNTARVSHYEPINIEDNSSIFLANCPNFFERQLNSLVEERIGKYETIVSYFRINTPSVDTELRIHSDRDMLGKQPTDAIIYYIDVESGGTGFFDHELYGDRLPEGVDQPESEYTDESLWTYKSHIEGKPNRLIHYPANLFHCRYPYEATSQRLVWVSFVIRS